VARVAQHLVRRASSAVSMELVSVVLAWELGSDPQMRCPTRFLSSLQELQCTFEVNHTGDCLMRHDGQEFFVTKFGTIRIPVDEFGKPLKFTLPMCTAEQLRSTK